MKWTRVIVAFAIAGALALAAWRLRGEP
ncbi:MAG: hypothetical protein RL325_1861, partial [Planctomycetota bacterium]